MENRNLIQKLAAIDLGPIAYKLMYPEEGSGWSYEQTRKALIRYLMFLFLVYLYPNAHIVPTKDIDLVWHTHILDTSKYAADCQLLFGKFIHHFPYFGVRGEADKQNWETAFAQTQKLFEQHFGADAVAVANPLEDGKSQAPAICETMKKQHLQRPTVHIELTRWA